MLAQFALQGLVYKHACRVIVAHVQHNKRAPVVACVVVLCCSVNKGQAGKATARIQAHCQLFAVAQKHGCDRARLCPHFAAAIRITPQVGPVVARHAAHKV